MILSSTLFVIHRKDIFCELKLVLTWFRTKVKMISVFCLVQSPSVHQLISFIAYCLIYLGINENLKIYFAIRFFTKPLTKF
jgi:hypothetical protein